MRPLDVVDSYVLGFMTAAFLFMVGIVVDRLEKRSEPRRVKPRAEWR